MWYMHMQVQSFTARCAYVSAALTLSCSQKTPISVFLCCSSLFTVRLVKESKGAEQSRLLLSL